MKLGIMDTAYPGRYGMESGFERMKAHGYDGLDYQGFLSSRHERFRLPEEAFRKELEAYRNAAEAAGLTVWQVHSPWQCPPVMDSTKEDRELQFLFYAKAVRGAAYLGAKYYAVHHMMPQGTSDTDPALVRDVNREFFGRLAEVGKEYGVTICMENMPFLRQSLAHPEALLGFVREMDHENLRMCLDTGHSMMHGMQPGDAVRLLGKDYLKMLHVHDNDGKGDRHAAPFTGVIDWQDFMAALREIGFDGCLSLETKANLDGLTEEEAEQAEIALADTARKLASL